MNCRLIGQNIRAFGTAAVGLARASPGYAMTGLGYAGSKVSDLYQACGFWATAGIGTGATATVVGVGAKVLPNSVQQPIGDAVEAGVGVATSIAGAAVDAANNRVAIPFLQVAIPLFFEQLKILGVEVLNATNTKAQELLREGVAVARDVAKDPKKVSATIYGEGAPVGSIGLDAYVCAKIAAHPLITASTVGLLAAGAVVVYSYKNTGQTEAAAKAEDAAAAIKPPKRKAAR